jgi:hypothetical protein
MESFPGAGIAIQSWLLSRAKALGLRSLNIADEGASHISKGREDKLTFGSLSVMPFLTLADKRVPRRLLTPKDIREATYER